MSSQGTVVELVDTPDLKSVEHLARAGSSPARPTGTQCAYHPTRYKTTLCVTSRSTAPPSLT